MRLRLVLLTIFMFAPLALSAADDSKDGRGRATPGAVAEAPKKSTTPVPSPPPLRDGTTAVEPPEGTIEPEITITTKGTEIHEEYRANGRLYMVKVVPAKGKPYYLLYDELGKVRRSDLEPSTVIPQWILKSW